VGVVPTHTEIKMKNTGLTVHTANFLQIFSKMNEIPDAGFLLESDISILLLYTYVPKVSGMLRRAGL
jgi:hypothetical protein